MLTLGEAIDQARDGHPAFHERNIPDSVVRRALARYERELYAEVVQRDSQTVTHSETIDLSTHTVGTGFTPTQALLKPQGGEVHFDGTERTARLRWIPSRNRKSPGVPWPAYYLEGDIFLVGTDDDWAGVPKVDAWFIPEPTLVSDIADTFTLPEGAVPAIVARAELEMAKRGPVDGQGNQPDVQAHLSLFQAAEQRFLNELSEKDRAEEAQVREEW